MTANTQDYNNPQLPRYKMGGEGGGTLNDSAEMPTGIPQVNPSAVVPELDYILPNTTKLQYLFFSERVLNGVFICLLFFVRSLLVVLRQLRIVLK